MKIIHFVLVAFLFYITISHVSSQSINLINFANGFTRPVDIKNADDSRLFIVEQAGKIRIIDSIGNLYPTPFLDIQTQVSSGGERGLLGLTFHPSYKTNGYFFVNYTDLSGNTRISRFKVSANSDIANPASEQNLFTIYQPFANHNGGNLMFGADGYLYINMGDGGSAGDPGNRAQNKDSLLGKILRIDVNNPNPPYYFSPSTNPFFGAVTGRDEIWALGLRNPWRSSFDKVNGDLWISDVGQNDWEEINFQPANSSGGENYGWCCYEGNTTFNTSVCEIISNYIFPVAVYSHSTSFDCSVTGGYIYRGGQWASLFGYYFYADYCSGIIRSIKSNGSGGWSVNNNVGTFPDYSFSTLGEDRYGELYIASLTNGIYKITGTICKPTAVITHNNTISDTINFCKKTPVILNAIFGEGLTYQWKLNGNIISGAISNSYSADSTGSYTVFVTNQSSCTNTSTAVVLTDTCTNGNYIVDENDKLLKIKIYPNPTIGRVVIECENCSSPIEIYNLMGEKINFTSKNTQQNIYEIDFSTKPKGIYFIRISNLTDIYIKKIVIY
ncbi:MAG: hypothetical protein A2046_12690 [Bacteroidetes bacterium GWA2_30_7]|nr:MAG: hypothetical protein A2046_12690 [Bacteroidetes bacterium GWA2_30_7]